MSDLSRRPRLDRQITPHMLRHAWARGLDGVADLAVVKDLLGHRHLAMAARYVHPGWKQMRAAIDLANGETLALNDAAEADGPLSSRPPGQCRTPMSRGCAPAVDVAALVKVGYDPGCQAFAPGADHPVFGFRELHGGELHDRRGARLWSVRSVLATVARPAVPSAGA